MKISSIVILLIVFSAISSFGTQNFSFLQVNSTYENNEEIIIMKETDYNNYNNYLRAGKAMLISGLVGSISSTVLGGVAGGLFIPLMMGYGYIFSISGFITGIVFLNLSTIVGLLSTIPYSKAANILKKYLNNDEVKTSLILDINPELFTLGISFKL